MRSNIYLTEKDTALLHRLKEELGYPTYSAVIRDALFLLAQENKLIEKAKEKQDILEDKEDNMEGVL